MRRVEEPGQDRHRRPYVEDRQVVPPSLGLEVGKKRREDLRPADREPRKEELLRCWRRAYREIEKTREERDGENAAVGHGRVLTNQVVDAVELDRLPCECGHE